MLLHDYPHIRDVVKINNRLAQFCDRLWATPPSPHRAPRPSGGRGVGGDWLVTIPQGQFDSGLDLSGLTEVQLWIGYRFVR